MIRCFSRLLAFSLAAMLVAIQPLRAAPVLLLSIDGLRPSDVLEAEQRGLKLPVLRRFIAEGTYAQAVRNVTPTLTIPNHTSLITGVPPAVHGIYDNLVFDPLRRRTNRYYWYTQDIKVPTLWDAVKARNGVVASLNWPVSVGATSIDVNIPLFWRDQDMEDVKLITGLASRGLVHDLETATPYTLGQALMHTPASDRVAGAFAVHILKTRRPRLFTINLSGLDQAEHIYGPGSKEAYAALENIDAVIGTLLREGQQAMPDLVVAVVSDHGFAPVHDDVNVLKAFVDAGLAKRDPTTGQFVAWEAMPWGYASAAVYLARPGDAELRARTAQLLKQLVADPAYHVEKILDLTDSAAFKAGNAPAYYIGFQEGYEMGQTVDAPPLTPSVYKGMHGYLSDMDAMNSSFFVLGKSVPHGRNLGRIDMLDIAPTLARILDTNLAEAHGRVLFQEQAR